MSKSSLEAAAEAAAKVNAMLIAKGKLKLSPSQIKPKIGTSISGRAKAVGDLVTAEVDINDAPLSARNLLTRGHTQDEICKLSGAAISTRGRYMTPEERQNIATPECRPLYLNVQASSYDAIKIAVRRIQEIIDHHVLASGVPKSATVGVVTYPTACTNGAAGSAMSVQTNHVSSGTHFVQDKVFIGLEQAPPEYPVREKILGPGGSFLQHIRTETGATVTLRGKGSGFIEPTSGREAFEPLYIHITHPKSEGLQAAKALAINLVETAHVEFAQWQQTQQQSVLQPLASVMLPQATQVAYQNQVMVTPAVLPVNPGALSTGTGVVATGIQIPAPVSAAPGAALTAGIPSLMHASVPTLVSPVSVVSSVPVSVQGIPSPTVITYPTYVANTNSVIARPAASVLARPAAPAVSIIGVVPTISATAAYSAARQRPPFQAHQIAFSQPVVYANVPVSQANLTQTAVPPTSVVMTIPETAAYPLPSQFSHPPPLHQRESDLLKHRYYNNGMGVSLTPTAKTEISPCLQESNVNPPTELQPRKGSTTKRALEAQDRDLMPPPVAIASTPSSSEKQVAKKPSAETEEPVTKKVKGALGGIASVYGSDDSDEEEDEEPASATAKQR
ncbi:hypothetical protein X975_14597, partial [Stegodyphus mimosarum]